MQLDVNDVAKFFNVSQRTVYRWIDQKIIPAYRINDQYRFNRYELIEWANAKKISVSNEIFGDTADTEVAEDSIAASIKAGGIYFRIEGGDKNTVLKNVVELMKLPDEIDRKFLLEVLVAREQMASTGVGDGIAIPHARNPVVLNILSPIITLCFLEKPLDFGSIDGIPVFCLFTLLSPSPRVHLKLISRLAFILRDPKMTAYLRNSGSREDILLQIQKAESKLSV